MPMAKRCRDPAEALPQEVELRDVFNAILYVNRTGTTWKYLPHDFPNHSTVYAYYAAWRDEGIVTQLNYDLTGLARVKEGRKPEPTASVIDTQSVKTSTNVPVTSQGTDAANYLGSSVMSRQADQRWWMAAKQVKWRHNSAPAQSPSQRFSKEARSCSKQQRPWSAPRPAT